jgi:vitamin B12 transporter
MHQPWRRFADSPLSHASLARRIVFTFLAATLALPAHAVIVRGRLTDPLGQPVGGGKVQLVQGGHNSGIAYANADGSYEIRSSEAGRFRLLGFGIGYLPSVGTTFYGGATDVVDMDVVLSAQTIRQEVSVTATSIPTPLPQLTAPVSVIPGDAFDTRTGIVNEMRLTPGAFLVQSGQYGGVTSLFMRGGNSTANLILVDGVPAEDVGGTFDFGAVNSTAIAQMELYRGPNSAIYGTDAGASVITIDTPRGGTNKPLFTYSGDAGNLHTYRNEATVSGADQRIDYFAAFSRFDTSNAVALARYHNETEAVNLGYTLPANILARFTLRNSGAVQGVPGPWDFQHASSNNRQGDQDLFTALTLERTTAAGWHNLFRYGIARKREQEAQYDAGGIFLADDPGEFDDPGNVGNVVTIRGANGYTATGQVQMFSGTHYDQDSNRDQLYYQSDYTFSPHFLALFGFRYDNERGSFNDYSPAFFFEEHQKVQRTNFEYNLQFQGAFWSRLFYSAGGAIEKNHLYGIAGTPKIGLTYVPVRPAKGFFHGTRLRANVATGVQEPTLSIEEESLYRELIANGYPGAIAQYGITQPLAERSRTYDFGLEQNIISNELVLKVGYFHNVFDRQLEAVNGPALAQYFGINIPGIAANQYFEGFLNSLAYRAQGAEAELLWQPTRHITVHGGYTYLNARVLQSFSTDAVAADQGAAFQNSNFPTTPIGALGPLVGARPFRRAPNTGFVDAEYARTKFTLGLKAAMASRSDDSTYLQGEDLKGENSLLLPNRNLDFGYVKLDLDSTYQATHRIAVFTQLDNLLNNQHIGPIGFPGLPFTVRAGVKLRLGGD